MGPAAAACRGPSGAYPLGMYFDPMYLLFLAPGMLLSFWASAKVKSTFRKYADVPASNGWSGADVARELLKRKGVPGVRVEPVEGFLSDHYDPRDKVLRLSPDVYHGRSLSAFGVAAHEAGHAIQHATSYGPLNFRSLMVKPATIGSNVGMILSAVGLALQSTGLIWFGIVLFSAFVVFTLITLPVEFDASKRAIATLQEYGLVQGSEAQGAKKVLDAAALTYVAGAISAIMQLLYFLMRAGLFSNDD